MNNQRDEYIKEKLQKDKLISKKADDVFNNFLRGDFNMKEEKVEKEVKTTSINKRNQKMRRILATAASILVVFGAANVYAVTQGYDNIFFMIKYLVTGENVTITGKDELLSDRDIAISYEPIKLTENTSIQVKNLQIKDNKAKLFLVVNEKEFEEGFSLTYKVYNDNDEELCTYKGIQTETLDEYNMYVIGHQYTEEIEIANFKESDKILKLEIYNNDSKLITTLKIDLESRTIEVAGEKSALEKISEIELKDYLGYIPLFYNTDNDIISDDWKLIYTCFVVENNLEVKDLGKDKNGLDKRGYKVEDVNKIMDSVYGMTVEELDYVEGNYFTIEEKDGIKYFVNSLGLGGLSKAECIDILNISYCGGLYTVTYTYCMLDGYVTVFDVDINDYAIYEHTITFELNEDEDMKEISKFRMVSAENPIVIRTKEDKEEGSIEENIDNSTTTEKNDNSSNIDSTVTNNNTTNTVEKVDNYASTMSWTEYWAPGLKIKYPTIFDLKEVGEYARGNNQGEISTIISGIATGIDPVTKEIINSNMVIEVYEPLYVEEIPYDELEKKCKYTTGSGIVWYEDYVPDENGGATYTHTSYVENVNDEVNSGWERKIIFRVDVDANYKVINIINWFLKSVEFGSY